MKTESKTRRVYKLLGLKNVQIKYAAIEKPREPKPEEKGKKPEYFLTVIFKKTDLATKKRIDDCCASILKDLGMSDEDVEPFYNDGVNLKNEVFHDYYYFNSRSSNKPDVTKADGTPYPNATWQEFSAGTYVNVALDICNYTYFGKVGFSKYIKHIQIMAPSDMKLDSMPKPDYQTYLDSLGNEYIEIPLDNVPSSQTSSSEEDIFA